MKWIVFLFLISANLSYSQDSTQVEVFEYRFKISKINNELDAALIEEDLHVLFRAKPIYYSEISEYVFTSEFSITRLEFEVILRRKEMGLVYYRKTSIQSKNGNE
jgi:hypothetical protein